MIIMNLSHIRSWSIKKASLYPFRIKKRGNKEPYRLILNLFSFHQEKLNVVHKIKKPVTFIRNWLIIRVAGTGLEPVTFGL